MHRILVLISFLFFSPLILAATTFPRGCEAVGFQYINNEIKLQPVKNEKNEVQTLYLLHNQAKFIIEVQNKVDKELIVAPIWKVSLRQKRWAAFAIDKKSILFNCKKPERNGTVAAINCQDVLAICQYPRAKFSLSNLGTYWVTNNRSKNEVVRRASGKGILLRW